MKAVIIIFLILEGCTQHDQKLFLSGQWCFSNNDSDFSISLFSMRDTVFLKYSYVLDNGNRINETVGTYSGYILQKKIREDEAIISVVDEYQKAINGAVNSKYVFDIKLSYKAGDSSLTWENTSSERSTYLPNKLILHSCKN